MSYFAPYIDGSGLHLPTYEDRLEDLVSAYRGIFGTGAELSPAVPDYQLLSVFARALDDVSALVLQAWNSRNPFYASGAALDLLLPQYGLTRLAGETDAQARSRIRSALASRGAGSADALLSAVKAARNVRDAALYVNDTDATDAIGIPPHHLAVVIRGGNAAAVAQAIFDRKAPGIGTWGSASAEAADGNGVPHTVYFTRHTDVMIFVYVFIRLLEGGDRDAIRAAVEPAVLEHVNGLKIAEPLNIPQLYGAAYAADPAIAGTFVITDIQVAVPWDPDHTVRDLVPCAWNEKISAANTGGVSIRFS